MSTNHLMGEGYWVWLIRLASGATSVGIVADPAFHSFDEFNTLAKAKAWLEDHEPQCAAVLAEHDDLIMDFRVMKKYSHGATKVFDGRDRWCLTGDAGIFLDPLYSSGLDLVAIGNGLITDMVNRDLEGEDVVARAQISDSLFRSLTEMWLAVYQDQYTLDGHADGDVGEDHLGRRVLLGIRRSAVHEWPVRQRRRRSGVRALPRRAHRAEQPGPTILPRVGRGRNRHVPRAHSSTCTRH